MEEEFGDIGQLSSILKTYLIEEFNLLELALLTWI